jgi:hypothetical protein
MANDERRKRLKKRISSSSALNALCVVCSLPRVVKDSGFPALYAADVQRWAAATASQVSCFFSEGAAPLDGIASLRSTREEAEAVRLA